MAFMLTSVLLALAYIYFMSRIFTGWSAYEGIQVNNEPALKPISIVIPFRNEEEHLDRLFSALEQLNYPAPQFEIIMVDDHSTDKSAVLVKEWAEKTALQVRFFASDGNGKKAAQKLGVHQANHDLIACTDADCIPGREWLQRINATFNGEEIKLAFGPVVFNSATNAFQRIEFVALIASTMAMLKLSWPVMGNGANMAFRKEAYLDAEAQLERWNTPSGDDVILLHTVGTDPNSVGIISGDGALVFTDGSKTLGGFIQQRLRWASKAKYIRNQSAFLTGGLVFAVNAFLFISLLLYAMGLINHWPFVLLFLVKFNLDFIFIKKVAPFFGEKAPSAVILVQEIINILYVPVIGLLSQLLPYTWKGRRY